MTTTMDRWSEYPLNITRYNALRIDGEREKGKLENRSNDLFSDTSSASSLKVLEFGGSGTSPPLKEFANVDSLKEHLEEKRTARTQFYSIKQDFSWGELLVSKEMFLKLLSHIQVFPDFLGVVYSFGRKIEPRDEGYSEFSDSTSLSTSGTLEEYESCYILKYVERHGRSHLKTPWSIRQMGVYHKLDAAPKNETNTWIFLQPRTSFVDRLGGISKTDRNFSTHLLLLSSSMEGWREYIDWLEDAYTTLNNIAIGSTTKGLTGTKDLKNLQDPSRITELEDWKNLSDIQQAQQLKKKLLHLVYIIELNAEAIDRMRNGAEKLSLGVETGSPLIGELLQYRGSLSTFLLTLKSHKRRTQNLLDYIDITISILQNILEIKKQETALKLSEIAGDQNTLMLGLSRKATLDARSMRTITIVALVYLPPTFVSGFFGMNIFQGESTLSMAQYIWIYFVVSIPLMAITFSVWYLLERKNTREYQESKLHNTQGKP